MGCQVNKFRDSLTVISLSEEYIEWTADNGNGRNSQDLRFGQLLANHYCTEPFPELFYEESAAVAYRIAFDHLVKELYNDV